MQEKTLEVRFHIFDFIFKPFKNDKKNQTSYSILKSCIEEINRVKLEDKQVIIIDRHEGRKGSETRNLFISSAAYSHHDKKYKCRIHLIRDNKLPTVVNKEDYTLTPIENLGANAIAETTSFYIDTSGTFPVVCCEFNNNGPRIADIEFYFRQIARKYLKIATACKAKVHMAMPINEVLDSITDVLKFKIKVKPQRLAYLNAEVKDSFVANMTALANTVEPQSIEVDAFFRERGKKQSNSKNLLALGFVKRALKAIKADNNIIDDFDDFTLEFEKDDGTEGDFSLIKGKEEITIECPTKSKGNLDTKKLYELAKDKFNEYLMSKMN